MADFRSRRRWTTRLPTVRRTVDEEIHPSSGWTNDFPGFHCLLVNLPGFEENDIKLNIDESGIIVVSGRRKIDDDKQEHFEKTFNVPEDGDVKNITKIFDGATLRVRIPKVAKPPEKGEPSSAAGASTSTDISQKDGKGSNIPPLDSIEEEDDEPVKPESPASSNGTKKPETEEPNTSSIVNRDEEYTGKPEEPQEKHNGDQVEGTELTSPTQDNNTGKPEEINKKKTGDNTATEGKPGSPTQGMNSGKSEGQKGGEPRSSEQEGKGSKRSVIGKIAENKGILIASLISFTLGVLLSQKIHPSSH